MEIEQASLIAGLDQLVDERGGGGEADREPALAGGQAETEGDMGLTGPAVAHGDHVLAPVDVLAAGQLHDQLLVDRGDGEEVEAVEALRGREACSPYAAVHLAVMAVYEFKLSKPQQVAGMVDILGGTAAGQLAVLSQKRRQPQFLQMVLQEHGGLSAHDLPPATSVM